MRTRRRRRRSSRAVALTVVVAVPLAWAGDPMPPPGPIEPTMKPLDEVEPRIALNQENTPGDFSSHLVVSEPGSYYLPADTTVSGQHGIKIAANDVTIDLMGHTLRGDESGLRDGVRVDGLFDNIVIRNGAINSFGGDGIDFSTTSLTSEARFSSLVISNNLGRGILGPGNSIVRGCVVNWNGDDGIATGSGAIIVGCALAFNSGRGIAANVTCHVSECNVSFNTGAGISALEGSIVTDCVSRANGLGVEVTDDCQVAGNNIDSSGTGILVTGSDCRIDSNQVSDCSTGIDVDGAGNMIIRNSVTGGTTQFSIVANNKVGPIVVAPNSGAISGSSGGAGLGTTDPWANISY